MVEGTEEIVDSLFDVLSLSAAGRGRGISGRSHLEGEGGGGVVTKDLSDEQRFGLWILRISFAALMIWGLYFCYGLWSFVHWTSPDPQAMGLFGDYFGAINSLFTTGAFIGVIYTAYLQRHQLQRQEDEISENRKAMIRQSREQLVTARLNAATAAINANNTYYGDLIDPNESNIYRLYLGDENRLLRQRILLLQCESDLGFQDPWSNEVQQRIVANYLHGMLRVVGNRIIAMLMDKAYSMATIHLAEFRRNLLCLGMISGPDLKITHFIKSVMDECQEFRQFLEQNSRDVAECARVSEEFVSKFPKWKNTLENFGDYDPRSEDISS